MHYILVKRLPFSNSIEENLICVQLEDRGADKRGANRTGAGRGGGGPLSVEQDAPALHTGPSGQRGGATTASTTAGSARSLSRAQSRQCFPTLNSCDFTTFSWPTFFSRRPSLPRRRAQTNRVIGLLERTQTNKQLLSWRTDSSSSSDQNYR